MDRQLNQPKTVIKHSVGNVRQTVNRPTNEVNGNSNESAPPAQTPKNRMPSVSHFAADTKATNSDVVRTAPEATSQLSPARTTARSTQQFPGTNDDVTSRTRANHKEEQGCSSTQTGVRLPDTATNDVAVIVDRQQQPIAHHIHLSPTLTTQSYYSGKLITDYTEPSPVVSKSSTATANHTASSTQNVQTNSTLANEAVIATDLGSASGPSMDTALSSIFSSTEFFAGWIGGAGGVVIGHPFDTIKVRMQTRVSVPTALDNAGVSALASPDKAITALASNSSTSSTKNTGHCPQNSAQYGQRVYNSAIRGVIEKAVALPSSTSANLEPSLGLNYNGIRLNNLAAYSATQPEIKACLTSGLNPHHVGSTSTPYFAPHNHDRRLPPAALSFTSSVMPEVNISGSRMASPASATAAALIDSAKHFVKTGLQTATTAAAAFPGGPTNTNVAKLVAEAALDYDPMPWSSRTGIVDVTKSDGMFSILEKMVRDEGARSMYRGMSFPLMSAGIINAVFFATYQASSRMIDKVYPFRNINNTNNNNASWRRRYATMFAAGAIGGATQLSIAVPVEVIKIKLQVRTSKPKLTESYHMCREIVRQSGARGLYRGLGVQAMRDIPACACYMLLYESLLDFFHYMRDRQGVREQTSSILLAGGLAGMFSWQIVIPFDVIKSRMQAGDLHIRSSATPKSSLPVAGTTTCNSKLVEWVKSCGLIRAWRDVVREEGWRGLTRGMLPVSLRALPTNAAIFYLYETSFAYLDKLGGASKHDNMT